MARPLSKREAVAAAYGRRLSPAQQEERGEPKLSKAAQRAEESAEMRAAARRPARKVRY